MSPLSNVLLAVAGFSLQAAAVNHVIVVGKDGLTFNPPDLKANLGDTLEFRFWAKNHSVVQGNWQEACQPNQNGFFSGFVPQADTTKPNDQVFKVTLEDTDPKVYYCSQFNAANSVNHCKAGMVGVINGLGNRTISVYKELAKDVTSPGNPSVAAPQGGSFEPLQVTAPTPSSSGGSGDNGNGANPTQTGSNTQQTTGSGSGAGNVGVSFGALAAAGAFAVALAF
ncbi:hypothetical protein V8F33_005680 [Rhypophila sp. PSN 637]